MSVPDRDGGEKGEAMHLPITTDSIGCLLRGALGFCRLDRTHCAIDFALDVVRDGLARRLCSFEERTSAGKRGRGNDAGWSWER